MIIKEKEMKGTEERKTQCQGEQGKATLGEQAKIDTRRIRTQARRHSQCARTRGRLDELALPCQTMLR